MALFFADGGSKVLDLNESLPDEYHLSNLRNTGDPGVADQLGIEHDQPLGFFGIAARSGLPLEQTASAVQVSHGIDVSDEVVSLGEGSGELDLKVLPGLADVDAVVLGETL
jgi:hypothetical protein